MDPRIRLGLLACAGVLAITLESLPALLVLVVLCGAPLPFLGIDRTWARRGVILVLTVVWSTVLSQGLFYAAQPRVPLLHLGPLVVYEEGVYYGLVQSLRFVAMGMAGIGVAVSTPHDRLFAAMVRLRVPFGLALMAVTALRFIPEVAGEILVVRRARARRGRPVHRRSPWAWLALEVSMLRPVVARCLRRSHALAESLDCRGFDPVAPRMVRRPLSLQRWEAGLLVVAVCVVGSAGCARVLFLLYANDTYYLPVLRPLYGFVRAWM